MTDEIFTGQHMLAALLNAISVITLTEMDFKLHLC
jgi:hypothetical protein